MIKSFVKVAIAVLLANALWHVASAYLSYYKFQDAVQDYAIRSSGKSEDEIKSHVAELAAQYDEPVDADGVEVRRTEQHTYIESKYTKPIAVFPGYERQWPFSLNADGYLIEPQKP